MREYRVYLAGAMGCYKTKEEANNWRKCAESNFNLMNRYFSDIKFKVFNPCDKYDYWLPNHKTEKEIMRYEMSCLKKCDMVLVNLKDLDKSIGTSDEILLAYLNNIPVIGFYEGDKHCLHPWKEEQINRIEVGEDALDQALNYILDYAF